MNGFVVCSSDLVSNRHLFSSRLTGVRCKEEVKAMIV